MKDKINNKEYNMYSLNKAFVVCLVISIISDLCQSYSDKFATLSTVMDVVTTLSLYAMLVYVAYKETKIFVGALRTHDKLWCGLSGIRFVLMIVMVVFFWLLNVKTLSLSALWSWCGAILDKLL